jgi:hypothetical protein
MGMSPIGRAVTFEDMLAIHRQCKDCLGRCRFTVQRPRQAPRLEYCGRAIEDMTVLTAMGRIVNGPGGDAHWAPGCSPEEWALTQVFMAGREATWCQLAFSQVTRHLWERRC